MGHFYDPLRAGVYKMRAGVWEGASLVATVHAVRLNSMSPEDAAVDRDELGRVVAAAADAYRLYSSEAEAMDAEGACDDDERILVLADQDVDDEEGLLSLLLHRAVKRRSEVKP